MKFTNPTWPNETIIVRGVMTGPLEEEPERTGASVLQAKGRQAKGRQAKVRQAKVRQAKPAGAFVLIAHARVGPPRAECQRER